jgi:quinol monooxygenase YgiN
VRGLALSPQPTTERHESLIVFSIQIVAPDDRRTALLRTLGSILGRTRVAPGCLNARLYSDLDKRKTLLLVEDWQSREQFERNLDLAKLNAIVAAIELSSEAPVVRVETVQREEGVEVLSLHRNVFGNRYSLPIAFLLRFIQKHRRIYMRKLLLLATTGFMLAGSNVQFA